MKNDNPCLDCPKRHLACWDTCPAYQEKLNRSRRIAEIAREQKEIESTPYVVFRNGSRYREYMDLKKRGRL